MLILAEDSLGWQNRLIDKASVQFRLTAKNLGAHKGSFFMLLKMTVKKETRFTDKERRMVDKVKEFWLNRKKGSSSIEVDYTLMYGFSTEETHVRIVTLFFFYCKS